MKSVTRIARESVAGFEHLGVEIHGRRVFLLRQTLNGLERLFRAAMRSNLLDCKIISRPLLVRRRVETAPEQPEIDGDRGDGLDRPAILFARLEHPLRNRLMRTVVQPEADGADGGNSPRSE